MKIEFLPGKVVLFLLFLFPLALAAQSQINAISGQVKDSRGQGLQEPRLS